ncbi:hypothetical protein AaE_005287 [Aphanomyces astaci]|uniref:RecQ-mediated genome instability protein 1 n=1 Tax=Aphanomyces astaci TaxID=112090 RepID=A0A6A5A892_APHAT|nr:hypothetical protein AaE_005287 [Aphanomyces astaci]
MPKDEQDEFAMTQFLFADIQVSCTPSLPPDLHNMHRVVLQGRYFLQIVDASNIAAGHEQRQEDTSNRMLKLCLTDGASLAYAIEHKPLRQLSAKTPRGTKVMLLPLSPRPHCLTSFHPHLQIIVENVEVRHGLLMLTSVVVLGASGNDALESMGSSTLSTTTPTSSTTHHPEQRSILPSSGLAVVVARAPTAVAPVIQPPSVPLPITPAAAAPQEPWDDASLSDEERATDPTVRHLFYGSPSSPTSTTISSTTRPPTKRTPVVHIGRVDSTIPSAVGGDPSKPFTYLSHTVGHVPSTWPTRRRVIKGFVKSVVSFEFQTGEYHLKVYVEDATRSILVSVESKVHPQVYCTVHSIVPVPHGRVLRNICPSDAGGRPARYALGRHHAAQAVSVGRAIHHRICPLYYYYYY